MAQVRTMQLIRFRLRFRSEVRDASNSCELTELVDVAPNRLSYLRSILSSQYDPNICAMPPKTAMMQMISRMVIEDFLSEGGVVCFRPQAVTGTVALGFSSFGPAVFSLFPPI